MSPLARSKILAYACGALAAGMFLAFIAYTLPYYLNENHFPLIWLAIPRFFPAIQPIVGILSDRARFGRAAFFFPAMLLAAMALLGAGLIPPEQSSLTLIIFALLVAALFFNIGINPYSALLADISPSNQRGIVSGAAQGLGFLGQVAFLTGAFLLYPHDPFWIFALPAVALAIGFAIVAFGVRAPHAAGTLAPMRLDPSRPSAHGFNAYLLRLLQDHPAAMILLGTRLLYLLGLGAILPFLTMFIATEIGLKGWGDVLAALPSLRNFGLEKIDPQGLAQLMAGVFLFATGVFAFPCGWLGDRIGKKAIFMGGLLVVGLAALSGAFAESITTVMGYMVLLGLGNAALSVLFYPFLTDLVPSNRCAEFAGLSALVETMGLLLAYPAANALINFNFLQLQSRLVFIYAMLLVLLAFLCTMFVPGRVRES